MYEDPVYPASAGLIEIPKIAEAADYSDVPNVRNQIERYLKGGKPLPRNLGDRIDESLPLIHEEIGLHTYAPRIFKATRALRQHETLARARLSGIEPSATAEQLQRTFEASVSDVTAPFREMIEEGWRLERVQDRSDAEDWDDENRTTVYLAAKASHSLIIIWEDAAKAMARVNAQHPEDKVLDFVDFDCSAIDIAERAYRNYSFVELVLLKIRRRSEPRRADLAEHDRGVLGLNMASISSHALDWIRSAGVYMPVFGVAPDEAMERLSRLAGTSREALRPAAVLMKRHDKYALVARNVAYMALQHDEAEVLREAAELLAEQHGVDPSEVWSIRIAGREPLASEADVADKFEDGQPVVLKPEETV